MNEIKIEKRSLEDRIIVLVTKNVMLENRVEQIEQTIERMLLQFHQHRETVNELLRDKE